MIIDHLLEKNKDNFWKQWKAKLGKPKPVSVVNGQVEPEAIANEFASSFQKACSHNSQERHDQLKNEFLRVIAAYPDNGFRPLFTIGDVIYHIKRLKGGKAPGLDCVTGEHLWFAPPVAIVLLSILFNACLKICYVPQAFAEGVIIPLLKGNTLDNTSTDSYTVMGN